jgi:hypothetical protein
MIVARRLNTVERLVLLIPLAALLSVLGFLIAGATATAPALRFPHVSLIPRGEVPFMQTVRALGTTGGGFLTAGRAQTPVWIIVLLVLGFGTLWIVCGAVMLRSSLRSGDTDS